MATVEPAEEDSFFQDVESQMADIVDTPESFLTPSAELEDKLLQVTKQLFDFAKQREPVELGPLPELLVEGFETDQIWEEIQLQNQPLWNYLNKQITNLQDKEIAFFTESKKNKRKVQHEENEEDDNQDDEEEDEIAEEPEAEEEDGKDMQGDKFFDLDEMENFIEDAEREEEEKALKDDKEESEEEDEDEEDLEKAASRQIWEDPEEEDRILFPDRENEDIDENASKAAIEARRKSLIDKMRAMSGGDLGSGDKAVTYSEFFDPPKKAKRRPKWTAEDEDDEDMNFDAPLQSYNPEEESEDDGDAKKSKKHKATKEGSIKSKKHRPSEEDEDEEDEEGDGKPKESVFEIRSKRMAEKIKKLEDANVAPKNWTLMGEANAFNRPINSLLETHLEFDTAYKPKPVITAEVTKSLEEIIIQRIKEGSWDDVIRKTEPVEKEKKELPELNFEKSKEGLAAEYEKMFMEKTAPKTQDELTKQQKEIQQLFSSLLYKLDSLSNFHFTPKPPRLEILERPNVPALQMEEIIPISASDASLLAPEELYEPKKETKAAEELSREEKKTKRRDKKRKRNKQRKQKDAEFQRKLKLNPELAQAGSKSLKGAMEKIKRSKNVLVSNNKGNATSSTQLFAQLTQESQTSRGAARNKPKKGAKEKSRSSTLLKL